MTKRRSRSRSRSAGSGGSILLKGSVLVILAIGIGFAVQTGAFTTLGADRSADIGVASDQNALAGLDITDSLTVGGGSGSDVSCNFGNNDLIVGSGRSDDVNTDRDVVVEGNPVDVSITTSGCVRVASGARLNGDIEADGDAIIENGGRVTGGIDAEGDVTIQNGARLNGDITAEGDVTIDSGGRGRGGGGGNAQVATDVKACGNITIENGARMSGDATAGKKITVENGGQINGDATAGETVTIGNGGRVSGDVEENAAVSLECSGGRQRLLGVTNNLNSDASVTVRLQNPNDGTVYADGGSGDRVQFTLAKGATQKVSIQLSNSPGSEVGFELTIQSVETGSSVTLQRSVRISG